MYGKCIPELNATSTDYYSLLYFVYILTELNASRIIIVNVSRIERNLNRHYCL